MTMRMSMAFLVVGGALLLLGLVLLLAVPQTGLVTCVIALLHLLVGLMMRRRERERAPGR